MARFYNPNQQQFTSQYAPAPLKYIDEAGSALQDQTNAQIAGISDIQNLLNLPGGYRTKKRAQDISNEYGKQISALTDEVAKNGNIRGGISKLIQLKNQINLDPEVQAIRQDQLHKENVDKLLSQPNFNQHIQNFINPNGIFNQTTKGQSFDPRWYDSVAPGNTNADYKPLFDQIKPVISKYYNDPNFQTTVDEKGNLHTQSLQTGEEVESLTKEDVKNVLRDYILNDPNALNKQSIIYNKAYHELTNPGSKYDANDALEDISNAFLGGFTTKKEIQKVGADKVSKGNGNGLSNGSFEVDGIPNDIYHMQLNLEKNGEASISGETAAALLGGYYDKKTGKSIISINNESPTFLSVPNNIAGVNNDKAGVDISKGIPYQIKLNQLRDYAVDYLKSNPLGFVDPKNGLRYSLDPSGVIHETKDGVTLRRMSVDSFIKTQNEYNDIVNDAKRAGIDINDPKYKSEIKQKDSGELDDLSKLSLAVNNLNGRFEFQTDQNSKNAFVADDNSEYIKGFITLSEDELKDAIPNYEKAIQLGIIKPQTNKRYKSNGDPVTMYNIPMIRKSEGNLADAVSSQMMNRYGDTKETKSLINAYTQANLDLKQAREQSLDIKNNINAQTNSKESSDQYSLGLRRFINQSFNGDNEKNNFYENRLDAIETSDASKQDKAKARLLLKYEIESSFGDEDAKNKYNTLLESVKKKSEDVGRKVLDEDINESKIKNIDGNPVRLKPTVSKKLEEANKNLGGIIKVQDSYRSYETQKAAYDSGKEGVAPPGKSFHEKGQAFDLAQIPEMNNEKIFKELREQGFKQHPNEWWHWSYGEFI